MAVRKRNGVESADVKLLLNKMNSVASKVRLGSLIDGQKGSVKGKYTFSVQGGAVGAVNLLDEEGNAVKLPANAIVTNCIIDVITAPTSASTPTIAFGLVSANDLKTATAIASLTGIVQGIPVNTVGTAIKITSEKTMTMTIAGTTLTDGKIMVFADYVVSE